MRVDDNPEIKKHVAAAKAAGKCFQCQHPWHDGMCSCGQWGQAEEEAEDLATSLMAKEDNDEWLRRNAEEVARIDAELLPTEARRNMEGK